MEMQAISSVDAPRRLASGGAGIIRAEAHDPVAPDIESGARNRASARSTGGNRVSPSRASAGACQSLKLTLVLWVILSLLVVSLARIG